MLEKFITYFLEILMNRGIIHDYVVMPHDKFRVDIGVQPTASNHFEYMQINFNLKINAIRHKSK